MTTNTQLERRILQATQLRAAAADGGARSIEGYAARFNEQSVLIWGMFREVIQPGAFADVLRDTDTRCLFNHDPNHVLGRTKAGTLRLAEDDEGLKIACDMPDTTIGRDVWAMVQRGDVSQMSFSFEVNEGDDDWQEIGPILQRTIKRVARLHDVAPVTFPAYETTEVSARARDHAGRVTNGGASVGAGDGKTAQTLAHLQVLRRAIDLAAL